MRIVGSISWPLIREEVIAEWCEWSPTGAGSGIGKATCLNLLSRGARVIGVDAKAQAMDDIPLEGNIVCIVTTFPRAQSYSLVMLLRVRLDGCSYYCSTPTSSPPCRGYISCVLGATMVRTTPQDICRLYLLCERARGKGARLPFSSD